MSNYSDLELGDSIFDKMSVIGEEETAADGEESSILTEIRERE